MLISTTPATPLHWMRTSAVFLCPKSQVGISISETKHIFSASSLAGNLKMSVSEVGFAVERDDVIGNDNKYQLMH